MGTIIYCNIDECMANNQDETIYKIMSNVAEALIKKGWVYSKHDSHICKYHVEEYFNEEDEQLIVINNFIELGKDFHE